MKPFIGESSSFTCLFNPQIYMAGKRKLREAWMQNEEFKPWLSRVEGDPTTCNLEISAELSAINRHKMTKRHTTNEGKVMRETQQEVQQHVQGAYVSSGVALATILFTCFIAEHNLPFTIADHLVSLMKVMFPDTSIAKQMTMGRTKCT